MNLTKKTGRLGNPLLMSGLLAGMVMLVLMQGMTTYTYDDYYYAAFLRDGLSGFLSRNADHYLVRNGRVLVHMAAELLLAGGSWVYSLGNTAIMTGCFLLGLRYLQNGEATDRLMELGGALVLTMLGTMRVFRSWFLCPADAVNYTLPLIPVFGMLLALGRGRAICAAALSLLCGATTELCSMIGFAAAALELMWEGFRRRRWDRMRILSLGCILCGLATILLSPATQDRVGSELSLAGVGVGFLRYANSIAAPGTSLLVLTLVTPLLVLGLPRNSHIGRAAVPMALLLASGWVLPRSTRFTAFVFGVFCLYVLLLAAAMILGDRERRSGFVLLAGLASAAIMTLSSSGSIRVTVPFLICLITVGAHLLPELARRTGRSLRGLLAAVLWIALAAHLPTVMGITGNYRIMQTNEQTLTGNPAVYADYDPRYCTQQVFMSRDYQRVYLQYLGLEETEIRYTYAFGPEIELSGTARPTLFYRDKVYLPLRAAVEARGGTVDLISDSFLEIRLGDRCFLYQAPTLYTPDGDRDVTWDFVSLENQFYIASDVLEEALGIALTQEGW